MLADGCENETNASTDLSSIALSSTGFVIRAKCKSGSSLRRPRMRDRNPGPNASRSQVSKAITLSEPCDGAIQTIKMGTPRASTRRKSVSKERVRFPKSSSLPQCHQWLIAFAINVQEKKWMVYNKGWLPSLWVFKAKHLGLLIIGEEFGVA